MLLQKLLMKMNCWHQQVFIAESGSRVRLRCNAPTFLADNDVIITWSKDSSGEKDTITKGQENGSKSPILLSFCYLYYCRILHLSTVFKKITLKLSFYNKRFKAPNPAGISVEISFRTRILQIGVLSIFPLFLQAIF